MKVVETANSIKHDFSQGTTTKPTSECWFRNFHRENYSFEDNRIVDEIKKHV